MAVKKQAEESLFIKKAAGHQKRYRKIIDFTNSSTKAAAVMLLAAVVSLIIANTDAHTGFLAFFHTEVGFVIGDSEATMSLSHIINDILMAVFFLMIGLEIKYEMAVGDLSNIRQALLPILAACGGVIFPALVYVGFNFSNPETIHGWGVPTATDIAFALGIMSLLGDKVPKGIKVFLTTLAVADDIIAILIIALFYGQSPELFWIFGMVGVTVVLVLMNRAHVYALAPYLLVGVVLWFCVYMSGIHSTIAGVLLAFTIPTTSKVNMENFLSWSGKKVDIAKRQYEEDTHIMGQGEYMGTVTQLSVVSRHVVPPAMRLVHTIAPWVNFGVLPLFALTNADVRFVGGALGEVWADPALYGVFFGLLLGKPVGIMFFSFIAIKLNLASLPDNTHWIQMLGAGILGGVGFTMAIFVANLAYDSDTIITTAKLAILCASASAGIIGFVFLWIQAKRNARKTR